MLTYNPDCGTSCVHEESGSGGTGASVAAGPLQQLHSFFHSVVMPPLQNLREARKFSRGFKGYFIFNLLV